jgi:glycosyltransferase involved in cell wall biosynthesis
MKIINIITGLNDGGTENSLFKICKYDLINEHIVISLTGTGKYYSLLKNKGIKVYSLNANFLSIYKFFHLIRLLIFLKPDIVQTWLVHADFVGGIAARIAGVKRIIWNIRYSKLLIGELKLSTILISKILSKLSFLIPQFVFVNSEKAKKIYEIEGYDKKKLKFIPNGYDLSILKPSKNQKKIFKKKIRLKKNIPLIGNIGRYDPIKGHSNLLNALSIIKSKNINFYCIFVGHNLNNNEKLSNQIKKLKLKNHVKLMRSQTNIHKVMNGIDLHVLSSISEGFPNVLAESMACGTPCVTSDVGDARLIVGKTGWVVTPNNPVRLAAAIEIALGELGNKNWNKRCNKARLRICKKFNIVRMINMYNQLWHKVCSPK